MACNARYVWPSSILHTCAPFTPLWCQHWTKHMFKLDITLFAFTWHHSFYLESSYGSCLGDIPITGSIHKDIGKLSWFGVLNGPQGLTLYDQRKHVARPVLGLAYLHCSPFIGGRLLGWERLSNWCLSIESSADVDSTGLVDPEGGSSVSNVPTLAAYCHLQDLSIAFVVVALRIEFKGDVPLLG